MDESLRTWDLGDIHTHAIVGEEIRFPELSRYCQYVKLGVTLNNARGARERPERPGTPGNARERPGTPGALRLSGLLTN